MIEAWRRRGGRRRVIVINNGYKLAPWADLLYACDKKWWNNHMDALEFRGEKWTANAEAAAKLGLIRVPLAEETTGLALEPPAIHNGNNGGYHALGLALHLGARRVVFLGLDLCEGPNGEVHWHGLHPDNMNNPPPDTLAQWVRNFETTPADLARAGVEVINASRRTALACYPRVRLEAALR